MVLFNVRAFASTRARMAVVRSEPWWKDSVRRRQLMLAGVLMALGGVVFVIALMGMAWILRPEALPVKRVDVTGSFAGVQQSELAAIASDVARGNFFMADLAEARRQFARLPWVDSVAVRRVWPDVLKVAVTEHRPFARWVGGGLVNVRGQLFFPDERTYPVGIPVLSGPPGSATTVTNQYRKVAEQVSVLGLRLDELSMDSRQAWRIRLSNGIEVMLGQQSVDARLARFVRAYPRAIAPHSASVARIDLRYPNGFAVKWRAPLAPADETS